MPLSEGHIDLQGEYGPREVEQYILNAPAYSRLAGVIQICLRGKLVSHRVGIGWGGKGGRCAPA